MKFKQSIVGLLFGNGRMQWLFKSLYYIKSRFDIVVFGFLNYYRYHKRLKSVKYVHLMWNDKFNKPFVDFLNEFFDSDEHFIICRDFSYHPVPTGSNVALVKTYWGFGLSSPNIKWIYTHSLGEWKLLDYFYHHKNVLSKSCWIVWGGVPGFYERRDKYVTDVCPYFGMYSVGEDARIIKKMFNPSGRFVNPGGYQFPISKGMLDGLIKLRKGGRNNPIVVQINHSVDESTIEMLEMLSKFRDENMVVRTVLSYMPPGHERNCKKDIIARGNALFGDRFRPIIEFMDPKQYADVLEENDILIMNQPRAQGLGNIVASLYLGKKVYIRGDVSSYQLLRKEGAVISDALRINELSWAEFIQNPECDKAANRNCALPRVDNRIQAERYAQVYGWKRKPTMGD